MGTGDTGEWQGGDVCVGMAAGMKDGVTDRGDKRRRVGDMGGGCIGMEKARI